MQAYTRKVLQSHDREFPVLEVLILPNIHVSDNLPVRGIVEESIYNFQQSRNIAIFRYIAAGCAQHCVFSLGIIIQRLKFHIFFFQKRKVLL